MGIFDNFFRQKKEGLDLYPTKALALMGLFNRSGDFNLKRDCISEIEKLGDKEAAGVLSRALARHKMTQDMREAEEAGDAELRDLTVLANANIEEQIKIIEEGLSKILDKAARGDNNGHGERGRFHTKAVTK